MDMIPQNPFNIVTKSAICRFLHLPLTKERMLQRACCLCQGGGLVPDEGDMPFIVYVG